jgi:hypothetical protein
MASFNHNCKSIASNILILCIPRVYANIKESVIRKIFEDLNIGTLDRIDIISKYNGKRDNFNRVFVHFKSWNNSENAITAKERLLSGKEIKIIYDDPWFWKVSAYREVENRNHSNNKNRKP